MKYKCKSIPLIKMLPTPQGFLKSLCDDCASFDCENPIERRKISVMGVVKEAKLLLKRDDPELVVFCEGYVKKAD